VLVLASTGTGATLLYNSEEHKLLADRGAAAADERTASLPYPTRYHGYTAAEYVAGYRAAKQLAVGFQTNNPADYSEQTKKVQDNSYWTGFAQRAGNLELHIPALAQAPARTLVVTGWDGTGDATFTFGELVSLYGDYRRTVHCVAGRCYLTNSDAPKYRIQAGTRPAGTIHFEYGTDCFVPVVNCGWRPDPVPTRTYLRAIGSGLWPPYGTLGNTTSNTAWPEEALDAGWWGDEMLRIANVNDWHFASAAVAWYIGMHRLALHYAILARTDNTYWNHALHYEASALHSLTDLFAFGHVVTSRDRTSRAMMAAEGLLGNPAYLWMENVIDVGGGRRDGDGAVALTTSLPAIQDRSSPRNDFMPSYRGTIALANRALSEKNYHDQYNGSGATVMNLRRQEFTIKGDGQLRTTSGATERIITETVRISLQTLFDAHAGNGTAEQIGAAGSSFFDALLNIPVFVKTHPEGQFNGRWTRYAIAVDAFTNAAIVPVDASACLMPVVDGTSAPPAGGAGSCMTLDRPTGASILAELLQRNGLLGKGDRMALDVSGNNNGTYDVGDFLAWVRANNATPADAGRIPVNPLNGTEP